MYAALRDHDPVHHVEQGDYWVLSRFADVFAAARDTATFSSAQGLTFEYGELEKAGLAEAEPMVMLDPPDHTAFRRLVGQGLHAAARRWRSSRPSGRSWSSGSSGCGATGAATSWPSCSSRCRASWSRYYLGVPEADWPRFDGVDRGHRRRQRRGRPAPGRPTRSASCSSYFSDLIEQKRADPGDDTISALVHTGGRRRLDCMQILGFAFTMVTGGNDTTTGMLGVAAELLTRFPDQRALPARRPRRCSTAPSRSCSACPPRCRAWPARPPATSSCTAAPSPRAGRCCSSTGRPTATRASSADTAEDLRRRAARSRRS